MENVSIDKYIPRIEAILFAAGGIVEPKMIVAILEGKVGLKEINNIIDVLNNSYEERSAAFVVRRVAGGYKVCIRPEYLTVVKKLKEQEKEERLSRAALEVLSIVAYKQPITRVEVDEIRGVNSDGVIKGLLERGFIRICGKKDVPGKPFLYATTKLFLESFGLNSLDELPKLEEVECVMGQFESEEVDLGLGEVAIANRENRPSDTSSAE